MPPKTPKKDMTAPMAAKDPVRNLKRAFEELKKQTDDQVDTVGNGTSASSVAISPTPLSKKARMAENSKSKKLPAAGKSSATPKGKHASGIESNTTSVPKKSRSNTYRPVKNLGKSELPMDVTLSDIKKFKADTTCQIKIVSPGGFEVIGADVVADGPFKGSVAVFIKPPQTLDFLSLPERAKNLVYEYYFAHQNVLGKSIPIEGKRSGEPFARLYSDGKKNRVGLLTTCKSVHEAAVKVLYAKTLSFDNPTVAMHFVGLLTPRCKELLESFRIVNFKKGDAKLAFAHLGQAKNLKRVVIERGVSCGMEGVKAIDAFYGEVSQFFDVLTAVRKETDPAGTKAMTIGTVLRLGLHSLDHKDRTHDPEDVKQFKTAVIGKAMSERYSHWTCLCGVLVVGHSCHEELAFQQELAELNEKMARVKKEPKNCEQCLDTFSHLLHGGAQDLALAEASSLRS